MYDPKDDGVTHINVYSKGKTLLGRFLSNFHECDLSIQTEDGPFKTIEGYWYWLTTWDDRLRLTSGWESKKLGRELRGNDWLKDPEFKRKILHAIAIKILDSNIIKDLLVKSDLPFTHYYVYNDKVIFVKEGDWIIEFLEFIRKDLKGNK